jgi:hypothetical protein
MAAIFLPLIASVGIVLWHAITWLRTGEWPSLSLEYALGWLGVDQPQVDWVGGQRIIDWISGSSVAGFLFVVSLAVIFAFTRNDKKPVPKALRDARMKRARKAAGWKS